MERSKEMIPIKGSPDDIRIKAKIQHAKNLMAASKPKPKLKNSFSKLDQFSNDCHDENGRFCEDTGAGSGPVSTTKTQLDVSPDSVISAYPRGDLKQAIKNTLDSINKV